MPIHSPPVCHSALAFRFFRYSGSHEGDESTIGVGYEAARRWIVDNTFRIVGPNREIYLSEAGSGSVCTLTEIQFPIATGN